MPVVKQDRRSKRIHHEEHEGHEEWKQAGLLLNFNVTKPKNGIKRFVLLRALRVLRGETVLYLYESLGA